MNTEMQKKALAARKAHLALLDLKKVVDEATENNSRRRAGSRPLGDQSEIGR
jgi:hypothetical protein